MLMFLHHPPPHHLLSELVLCCPGAGDHIAMFINSTLIIIFMVHLSYHKSIVTNSD